MEAINVREWLVRIWRFLRLPTGRVCVPPTEFVHPVTWIWTQICQTMIQNIMVCVGPGRTRTALLGLQFWGLGSGRIRALEQAKKLPPWGPKMIENVNSHIWVAYRIITNSLVQSSLCTLIVYFPAQPLPLSCYSHFGIFFGACLQVLWLPYQNLGL